MDWVVAGVAAVVLGVVDVAVRPSVGYFLVAGVIVGVLTAVFPMFAAVGFGLLPLVFVQLPRWGAVLVGVVTTGSPYVVQPLVRTLMAGAGWEREPVIRLGPAYFVLVGVALPVLTGLFTAGAVQALRRQSRYRQALLDQLSATRAELANASRLAGQAEERQRLAHELHDTLAQGLSGVLLQLEAAEQHLDGDSARLVVRAREIAGSCLVDTRRAVAALRPEPLDKAALADAVRQLCVQWAELTGIPADCAVQGPVRRFRPQVEVVALRVVQEALTNARKHAASSGLTVTVEYGTQMRLVVRDDGCGFDPAIVTSGFGLATMRERVASIGGTLSVSSVIGTGTTVTATLPDVSTGDSL
ncbi:signal transduction histidine kinase [Kibdelosporangium banguiense]|uniref:Oxygen sensor histidine kinase NreB n=1 Tax=Kibdelosporangium banguiense TaxID=1365924 RepID=A0ABS4U1K2_9PSEU|nr:sensor histidine kinase [Kibdelosporangium banguiense]MBP2330531.1 signal transduction histidine kinase [Kibdelosporangium banguiense]